MAVTAFRLPSAPVIEEENKKTKFTPIDTTQLPTKEMAETFAKLIEINKARKQVEDSLETQLAPYFEADCPEGKTVVFGFRYNSIAFNFVDPKTTKGKLVLQPMKAKK